MDPENSGPQPEEKKEENEVPNQENENQEEGNQEELKEGNEEGEEEDVNQEGNEEEEGEEDERDEKKGNYNSKELEDFLQICSNILLPLEKKEVIKRSLTSFNNNIKNSLDQIVKNFTLQKIELPNESDEMIAKERIIVHALEKI